MKTHLTAIYAKLGVRTRRDAVARGRLLVRQDPGPPGMIATWGTEATAHLDERRSCGSGGGSQRRAAPTSAATPTDSVGSTTGA